MDNESPKRPLVKQKIISSGFLNRSITWAKYLGNVQILRPLDIEMCGSVVEIYDSYQQQRKRGRTFPVFELDLSRQVLSLLPMRQGQGEVMVFHLKRIVCCGVDSKNQRIFVFNYHETSQGRERLYYRTHAILCDTKEGAKNVAIQIGRVFRKALVLNACNTL